jgi:hypothetical protein
MKYLITESQRDKIVFRYLDNQDFEISKIGASTYFKHPDDDGFAQIKYGGKHHNNELCFIYVELIKEVSSFFSLEDYKSESVIGQWVKEQLNLEGRMYNNVLHSEWSLKIPTEY